MERLDVEIDVELGLFARFQHVQRVAADAGRHALGLDQVDHLPDDVDLAAVHHIVVGLSAVRIDHRGALVDLQLDLVVHLGLVVGNRDARTIVCIFVAAGLVVLQHGAPSAGSIWIVLMPHAWANSRVSKILASVL